MTNPKIRLFLVLGMAVAMLAAILWVGLILSASPVSADEGTPPDGGTPADEGTPPDGEAGNSYTATITPDETPVGDATAYTLKITEVGFNIYLSSATIDVPDEFEASLTLGTVSTSTGGKDWTGAWNGDLITLTANSTSWPNDDRLGFWEWVQVAFTATATTPGTYDFNTAANWGYWYDPPGPTPASWYVFPDNLSGSQPEVTVNPPAPPIVTGVYSSNNLTWDGEDNSFLTTGDVYAHITTTGGSPGGTISVNIYVTAEQNWSDANLGQTLTDVSGGYETVTVPTGGGTFLIWSHFTTAGNYDIVVDVNKDGLYGCPLPPPPNPDVVDAAGTYIPGCPHGYWVPEIGFTVSKANATIVVTPYDVPYDANAHTATGTATGAYGEDLFGLLNLTGTTHTNAGDYPTDPWSFAGNAVYNSANGTVHDIIHKVDATIVVTPYDVTYDGNAHTATGMATGVGGVDLTSLLDITGTTHTNAGDYPTDPWSFAGDINYNSACSTVHDIIHKADAIIVVTPYDVTYDGNPYTATGTATGVNGEDLFSLLDITGTTHIEVGNYTDPWSFAGDTNYNSANGTVNDIITSAPLTFAGAPEVYVLVVDWFGIWQDYRVTSAGVLLDAVYLTSADGTATLVIPAGTLVLDADGQPLYLHRDPDITVTTAGTPTAPEGTTFVAVYELLPNGTTFKYGEAQLIATYDPTLVPEGSVLVMAYYNEPIGQWVELETAGYVVAGETVPNTVVTQFDHLTYFALLAKLPAE